MIKLHILNLIFKVKKLKLHCSLTAVLESTRGIEKLHLQQPATPLPTTVMTAFSATFTSDKHTAWIRILDRGKYFLPRVSDAISIFSNEEKISLRKWEMYLVFPGHNYSALICKILRQKINCITNGVD